jgi:5-methylcytosine-specific restriction endonuclease McrA
VRLPSASVLLSRHSELSFAVCSSQSLDHAVPQARLGCNSYRNLVSSCIGCNSQKGEKSADDFLRRLDRERRLTATELAAATAPSRLSPPASSVLPFTGEPV